MIRKRISSILRWLFGTRSWHCPQTVHYGIAALTLMFILQIVNAAQITRGGWYLRLEDPAANVWAYRLSMLLPASIAVAAFFARHPAVRVSLLLLAVPFAISDWKEAQDVNHEPRAVRKTVRLAPSEIVRIYDDHAGDFGVVTVVRQRPLVRGVMLEHPLYCVPNGEDPRYAPMDLAAVDGRRFRLVLYDTWDDLPPKILIVDLDRPLFPATYLRDR